MSKSIYTNEWKNSSNIYEVNVRQYTHQGTFNAFAKHLPRLKEMGVKILWLMPITPISKKERQGELGSYYACSDYVSINPEFGDLNDFKNLVRQAHELDMKLIIDWVANHTGYDHGWTEEHDDWYEHDAQGNFTEQHGWADVIDLNYQNKDLRAAMIECMRFWINECDIDGFRCDMAHLVPLDFWVDAKQQCEAIKPLFWLAECEVPEYHKVFDATYAWKWMHATEKLMKGYASLQDVKNVLKEYQDYPQGALKLFFTANHDENSWNGTEYEKYGEAAKTFAVFTFVWSCIPLIYSGQELPNLKRLKFFDKDEIEWNNHPSKLENFYKKLTTLKSSNPALQETGNINVLPTDFNESVFAFLRFNGNSKVLAIFNFSNKDKLKCMLTHPLLGGNFTHLFSDINYKLSAVQTFELQAWEYIVLWC
ncbi:MAG: 1,4-alpha-glucan branching protein [Parafilimonas sp.]|nr:1,4-alpha-glucan branching protein [Parafilimonas sp.]